MFDSSKEVEVAIPSPASAKNVIVKYPEDALIIKRAATLKTIISSLGRGKTKTEPMLNSEQVDAGLLKKISVSGDALDAYEARRRIGQLLRVEILGSPLWIGVISSTRRCRSTAASLTQVRAKRRNRILSSEYAPEDHDQRGPRHTYRGVPRPHRHRSRDSRQVAVPYLRNRAGA
jgi:hypothetical protein